VVVCDSNLTQEQLAERPQLDVIPEAKKENFHRYDDEDDDEGDMEDFFEDTDKF